MIVKYLNKNVLTVYLPGEGRDLTNYQLLPGNNEVADADWDKIKEHPGCKQLLSSGALICIKPANPDNKKSQKGLARYGATEALEIIEGTYDKVLLLEWRKAENRGNVSDAITDQIKKIDDSLKKKEDEDED